MEDNGTGFGDTYFFLRARIDPAAFRAHFLFESAEAVNGDVLPFCKFLFHGFEDGINIFPCLFPGNASGIGDGTGNVFSCEYNFRLIHCLLPGSFLVWNAFCFRCRGVPGSKCKDNQRDDVRHHVIDLGIDVQCIQEGNAGIDIG